MTSMTRVAIIGCGKIDDQHVLAIRRIPGSRVVAVCDREALMADQLAERFGIEGRFCDHRRLLDSVAPAEVRCRPLARTVIADVARAHPAPAGVARLATLVGLTR